MIVTLPSTRFDVSVLVRTMRASDVRECAFNAIATNRKTEDWSISRDLHSQFDRFPHWSMWHPDGLVGICGVAPIPNTEGIGAIWFLGTDLADRHWRAMTRASMRFVSFSHKEWPVLGNIVPSGMAKRIRWLEKLGFDFKNSEAQSPDMAHVSFWSHANHGP